MSVKAGSRRPALAKFDGLKHFALLAPLLCLALPETASAREWVITVGGKVTARPPYEGATTYNLSPAPTFSVKPAKEYHRFNPPGDGTTIALIATRWLSVGPMARFRSSRGETGTLEGFKTIGWAAEPGGFIDLWPTDWLRARVEIRRGVTGHSGWVGDAGVDLVYSSTKFDFAIGPRVGFGDARYNNTYFGVTPEDAARSPRIDTVYMPGEGRRYTGLKAGVAYHFDEHWKTTLSGGYQRLAERVTRSPVVQLAGERDQYSAGVAVSYSFRVGHQ